MADRGHPKLTSQECRHVPNSRPRCWPSQPSTAVQERLTLNDESACRPPSDPLADGHARLMPASARSRVSSAALSGWSSALVSRWSSRGSCWFKLRVGNASSSLSRTPCTWSLCALLRRPVRSGLKGCPCRRARQPLRTGTERRELGRDRPEASGRANSGCRCSMRDAVVDCKHLALLCL